MVLNLVHVCAVAVLSGLPLPGQEPVTPTQAAEPQVTVTIRDTAAPPNWELSVPVTVTLAAGAEVGRLSLRLPYPTKALRYESVKGTDTLKKAGFDVTGSAPATKLETGAVSLEFRPAVGTESKGLPSGTVAIVVFKVQVDAETKDWPMKVEDVRAWGPGTTAAELKAAAGPDAKFTVSPAGLPIFGCFFYMH